MQSIVNKYSYAKSWYAEANKLIRCLFGDDSYLFIDILAATSAHTMLQANWTIANQIYIQHKSNQPIDYGLSWPSNRKNIDRALQRKPLQGHKVAAFAENLKGNLDTVCIDTWIYRFLHWERIRPKMGTPSQKQYQTMANRIRRLAKRYNMKPAELQAILWTYIRDKAGFDYMDFHIVSGEIPI